jgi:serine/threonine protein kinase
MTSSYFKPKQFGKYLLLDRIAIGGMAEIYKAKQFGIEGFEKLIVIKKILPHLVEDKEFIDMFIDEAKIAVVLNHSNIAQVYELGHFDNQYFIALEYIEGKNLREILKKCEDVNLRLSIDQATYIASELLKGMDYAHRKRDDATNQELKIIHRDISPQNIMLSYEGEVKIVDFGIARAEDKISQTQAGILKGKFHYMSPEQAKNLEIDQKSDIFSTGILLWEMLTARRLFLTETDFETLERVKTCKIPAPSKINTSVPEELDRIVLKLLAKDQTKRYQVASEAQQDLVKYLYTSFSDFTVSKFSSFLKSLFSDEIYRDRKRLLEIIEHIKEEALYNRNFKSQIFLAKDTKQETSVDEKPQIDTASKDQSQKSQPTMSELKGRDNNFENKINPDYVSISSAPSRGFILNKRIWLYGGISIFILGVLFTIFLNKNFLSQKNLIPKTTKETFGFLSVETTPASALVYISSKNTPFKKIGLTPLSPYKLPSDNYKIKIVKEGYKEIIDTIDIRENKTDKPNIKLKNYNLEKIILYSSVLITSNPASVQIIINNKDTGFQTPKTFDDLIVGETYEIKLIKDSYLDYVTTFSITDEVAKEIKADLNLKLGRFIINSTPVNADIYISDEKYGKTPLEIPNIVPGKVYKIRLIYENSKEYFPFEQSYILKDVNAPREINIKLAAKPVLYGHVFVQVKPWAYIYINGKPTNETTPKELKLKIGGYKIELTHPNFKTLSKNINIKENAKLKIIGNMLNQIISIE